MIFILIFWREGGKEGSGMSGKVLFWRFGALFDLRYFIEERKRAAVQINSKYTTLIIKQVALTLSSSLSLKES